MPKTVSQENKTYANLITCAREICDRRMQSKIDYVQADIIIIALCAVLAGANGFVDISQYGNERKRWLNEYFAISGPIPSHDTFNRVFGLINPRNFTQCMLKWLKSLFPESKQINIDAKILRGYRSNDPFSILRAWSCETKSILEQIRVPYGTNEIVAIPMLLDLIDVTDKIVTIDAIGAQKGIIKKIADKRGDYLISLKANQHTFFKDISLYMDSIANNELANVPHTYYETSDYGHGRIEKRCCWSTEDISWLEQRTKWKKLRSLSIIKTTVTRDGKQTTNKRYFISSLALSVKNPRHQWMRPGNPSHQH